MRIYGLDFTSVPSRRKPITCAACDLQDGLLQVQDFQSLTSFEDFENFLRSDGPWLAALDFPFGQPRKLIKNLGWPQNWADYMQIIALMDKKQFEAILTRYQEGRPAGDKQHLRVADILANARSPMMMYRVPVGKMFFEGATRLLRSEVSILPCRPTHDNRIVFEGYPALMARKEIVDGLHSDKILKSYGLRIGLPGAMAEMLIRDATGDRLDAVLCAVQAGWAFLQRDGEYGIPADCDVMEGWIVDPAITPIHPQSPPASPPPQ